MPKYTDPKTYAKNVVKSAGYIATETIKGVNPNLTSFITDTSTMAKDMYRSVKNYKHTKRDLMTKLLGEGGYKEVKNIKRNALDDLRTGRFYNPQREDAMVDKMAKDMGLSFDFDDINFDVDDEDIESSSDSSTTKAVMTMGDKIAMSQTAAASSSTAKITAGASKNARMSMAHNERLFSQVNNSLAVVNASIMNLHQDLATPLNAHIVNSTNFYNAATGELAKQTSYLENINKMLTERFTPVNTNSFGKSSNASSWGSVMGSSGIPNIGAWKDIAVKRSIEKSGLDGIFGMDPEMIQMALGTMGASPISTIATMILTDKLQSGATGKALNRTSNMVRNSFLKAGANIHMYNKQKKGKGIFGMLANLLDIAPDEKKAKLDYSRYNKGRQDWTGMDSKALREVIPTQLAAILSAITGEQAKVYDYAKGKFVTTSKVSKDFANRRRENISNSMTGFRNEIIDDFIARDNANLVATNSKAPGYTTRSRDVINLGKDFDQLMNILTIKRVDISMFKKKGDIVNYCLRNGIIKRDGTGIIRYASVKAIDDSVFKTRSSSGSFYSATFAGSVADNEFISNANDSLGATASVGSGLLTRRTGLNSLSSAIDDKGNNVFFYLQDYYKQLRMISNRISGSGKAIKNSKGTRDQYDVEIPVNTKVLTQHQVREAAQHPGYRQNVRTTDAIENFEFGSEAGRQVQNAEGKWETRQESASTRASRARQEKSSFLSRGIDKINDFFDGAFFGNMGEAIKKKYRDEGGLFGFLTSLPKSIGEATQKAFQKAKDYASKKWDQFKNSKFGKDFFGATKDVIGQHFKNTKSYAKQKAAKLYEWSMGKEPSWAADVEANPAGSYRGGHVRKSGMVSVSEGELIVPAHLNPYYTGHMGSDARKSIESTNYRNWLKDGGDQDEFFGFFRKGGKAGQWTPMSKGQKESIRKMASEGYTAEEIAKKIKKPVAQVKQVINAYNVGGTAHVIKEEAAGAYDRAKNSEAGKKFADVVSTGAQKLQDAINYVCGEGTTQNIKETTQEAMRAAKVDLPRTAATGMLGAITGAALTGSGIGLLGGFAVGAGVTILKNSTSLSKKLFGEQDENGEWKGGKLPSSWTKFIKDKLPKAAQAGTVGGILGTLGLAPGGIFGGMILGSGLELLSTTNAFQDIMLGKPDINGERHGGIAGSIKLHVVDPLANFVKDGTKKLGDYINKNFLDPMKHAFDPIKDWAKGMAQRKLNKLIDDTKAVVSRTIGEKFNAFFKPLTSAVGKAGKGALKAAGAVVSAPFRAAGKAGDALTRHNIRMGYSTKNIDQRMKLLAPEKNTEYNRWLASLKPEERDEMILQAEHYMNGQNSIKRGIINKRQTMADTITASLVNGGNANPEEVKRLKKLFNSDKVRKGDDFSEIIEAVSGLDDSLMGADTKKKVTDYINSMQSSIRSDRESVTNYDANRAAFFNKIGYSDPKMMKKFIKRGQQQSRLDAQSVLKAQGKKVNDSISDAKMTDDAKKLLEQQEKDNPLDTKRNTLLDSIKSLISGIATKMGVTSKDIPKTPKNDSVKTSEDVVRAALPSHSGSGFDNNPNQEAEPGDIHTHFTEMGPVQYKYSDKGQYEENESDAGTSNTLAKIEEDRENRNKFFGMFTGGGLLASIKGLINPDKEDKNKPSLWEKVKGFFGNLLGSNGILGKIFTAIGGATGLAGIIGAGTLLGLSNKFGENSAGTSSDAGMRKGDDPEARKKEVEGWHGISGFFKKSKLGFDALENKIRGRDMLTYEDDDFVSSYATDRVGGRVVKNAIMSANPLYAAKAGKNVVGAVKHLPFIGKPMGWLASKLPMVNGVGVANAATKVGETSFGKAVSRNATKLASKFSGVTDAVKNAGKLVKGKVDDIAGKAAKGVDRVFSGIKNSAVGKSKTGKVAADVLTKVKGLISKVINIIGEKLGLKTATSSVDEVVESMASQICTKGGTKLAKSLAKVAIVTQIAFITNAVIEGAQSAKAKTILGILDDPTVTQRILAAACNGINEAIPGIGGIIPTEHLFSIIYTGLEFLGCDFGRLTEQRSEAKAKVKSYNEENGTTYNIEEYIHNVQGDYTFQQNVSRGAKKVFTGVKNFFGIGKKKKEDPISESSYKKNDAKLNNSVYGPSADGAKKVNYTYHNDAVATGSGIHTTQKGNMSRFGHTTIDQNGCGPAVASTVLKSYGKNVGINNAATYAEAGGYVAGSSGMGTRASYFGDILGRHGIRTAYTDNQTDIRNAVASGNPTILLGQDNNNKSKSRSPFGPNPHYVVARGTDSNGNIVVDDPELRGTALYKSNILKNAKLGVATGGDSGISGLLGKFTNGLFGAVGDKLGDSKAGKLFKTIFGFNKDEETDEAGTAGFDGSSGFALEDFGSVSYGKSPFPIATAVPGVNDPNISLYNNRSNGGVSQCIAGSPAAPNHNILSNCVGWACARFNHIYNLLTGNKGIKFPQLNVNAGRFISQAKSIGLSTGMTPQAGSIMVWTKDGGAGHVAIVERVESEDKVYTSESGYGSSTKFWNKTRTKGSDGNWGASSRYHFIGFVYNPAVTAATAATGDKMSTTESQKHIFRWLTNNGFSKIGAAGAMGCWQAESRNLADRVEGDYLKSYPGSDTVLASARSLSRYTEDKLFPAYARSNLSINKSAYKGSDGNYYPGIGLAQWTGPRAYNLIAHANKLGKSFRSTDAQLDFFKNAPGELPSRKGLVSSLNGASTPEDAATIFLDGFEMSKGWHKTKTGSQQNAVRRKNARLIYNSLSTMDTSGPKMNGTTGVSNSPNWVASGSGLLGGTTRKPIPISHNFTSPIKTIHFAKSRGSASGITTPTSITTGGSSDKKMDTILLFLKQIATNTGYNAAIPALVDIMKQSASIIAGINNSSGNVHNEDAANSINREIDVMRSKLEAIAQTL